MPARPRFLIPLFLLASLAAQLSLGCSVPVFRYALEHWAADPFQVLVFHRGTLKPQEQALVNRLAPASATAQANARLRVIDLDKEAAPDLLALWRQQNAPSLPWVAVRYPFSTGIAQAPVSGPLNAAIVDTLFDSPIRQQILSRLGDGESAVWVLLESGDAARDDRAAALVEERLDYLEGVLTLPKLEDEDIAKGLVSVAEDELRLDFSLLRVSRTDPQERALVQMLLHSEPDLVEVTEPMVFPIFGRGRALYALVGEGIRSETIEEAATFLIGKCSCQVKEQNPGVDLLFSANWDQLIRASPLLDRDLPKLEATAAPAIITVSGTDAGAAKPIPSNSIWLWLLVGAIAAGSAILWMTRRRAR